MDPEAFDGEEELATAERGVETGCGTVLSVKSWAGARRAVGDSGGLFLAQVFAVFFFGCRSWSQGGGRLFAGTGGNGGRQKMPGKEGQIRDKGGNDRAADDGSY